MKIAIPVKMNKENAPVASLFGKAKWFAIVEDGQVNILANPAKGGQAVVEWLAQIKVDTILLQEMGKSPYLKVQSYGNITLYHTGFDRILLEDVLKKFENNDLTLLDESAMDKVIAHHEIRHQAHTDTH
jgi:predicted Fe-Mo cluster-binding NifX family protein